MFHIVILNKQFILALNFCSVEMTGVYVYVAQNIASSLALDFQCLHTINFFLWNMQRQLGRILSKVILQQEGSSAIPMDLQK